MPKQASHVVETTVARLTERINDALPQTQCTRCGYPSCRDYAQAIATQLADINRCPPGGAQGIERLARITQRPVQPLDAGCGIEGPRTVAWVIESQCIGCALCIKACPVDCIVGTPKRMHTVIESQCTGCELCLPACPVDCIALDVVTAGRSGWQAWSPLQAADARRRFESTAARRAPTSNDDAQRDATAPCLPAPDTKQALIQRAVQRARARQPKPPG